MRFIWIAKIIVNLRRFENMVKDIRIEDYTYPLPEERIAKYPLKNRDDSKLLVYTDETSRKPISSNFTSIANHIPSGSLMVFNNTKVVPARLFFKRESGASIEIFCLKPLDPEDYELCFAQTCSCRWMTIVGNAKRWKGESIGLMFDPDAPGNEILREIDLKATLIERSETFTVEFTWNGGYSFSKVMELCGKIPIPPYLKRETESIDLERYQTYYAKNEGSVAAPTAGLHFTQKELDALDARGIIRTNVCLHVGAGTFLPVKSDTIGGHTMHREPFSVDKTFLKLLSSKSEGPIVSVGTTSTRTLESLYFLGVQCIEKGEPTVVSQWEPYREQGYDYSLKESIDALIAYLDAKGLEKLTTTTRIIIVPGYKYRVIDYLVTNFHQPQSTLLLLVGALVGDKWKDIYKFALENGFRFLSYGDSSLLQKDTTI